MSKKIFVNSLCTDESSYGLWVQLCNESLLFGSNLVRFDILNNMKTVAKQYIYEQSLKGQLDQKSRQLLRSRNEAIIYLGKKGQLVFTKIHIWFETHKRGKWIKHLIQF
jgi:hypothetical protein